jgi:hypothetical protein
MTTILMVLTGLAMLATLGVMFAGMIGLVRSDEAAGARSNRLMRARVILQGVTVLLFILLMAAWR